MMETQVDARYRLLGAALLALVLLVMAGKVPASGQALEVRAVAQGDACFDRDGQQLGPVGAAARDERSWGEAWQRLFPCGCSPLVIPLPATPPPEGMQQWLDHHRREGVCRPGPVPAGVDFGRDSLLVLSAGAWGISGGRVEVERAISLGPIVAVHATELLSGGGGLGGSNGYRVFAIRSTPWPVIVLVERRENVGSAAGLPSWRLAIH